MIIKIIKNLINLLIPPIIILAKNKFKNKYFGYLFVEKYFLPDEIENIIIKDSYLNKNQHFESLKNFLNEDKKILNFNLRSSLVPIFLVGNNKTKFNILDIGGGFNSCFKYIKFSTNIDINVTVLERLEIVDDIYKHSEVNKELIYLNNIPDTKFDIIYYGSSFQYFLHSNQIFADILKINPEYIIISETTFTINNYDIFSFQVNMFPSIIPYKINSLFKVKSQFNKNGYSIIYESRRSTGKHKHLNQSEIFTSDLIFKKND